MLFFSLYFFRRFAAVRRSTYLFVAATALMLAAEFALLAAPAVSADVRHAAPAVLLEGRYSGEPLLVPQKIVPLDDQASGEI
jgi:hypothetical protein